MKHDEFLKIAGDSRNGYPELNKHIWRSFGEGYDFLETFRQKQKQADDYWQNTNWVMPEDANAPLRQTSPIIYSTVENQLADIMDNYPTCVIRGATAEYDKIGMALSQSVYNILRITGYQLKFRDMARKAVSGGVGIQQVYLNKSGSRGLGSIEILNVDPMFFFADPLCGADINNGMYCGKISFIPIEQAKSAYGLKDTDTEKLETYAYDDKSKTYTNNKDGSSTRDNDKARVIEFYFKTFSPVTDDEGKEIKGAFRTHINFVKTVCGKVVSVIPDCCGNYEKFPFVVFATAQMSGAWYGLGIVDIFRQDADIMNLMQKYQLQNIQLAATLRYLVERNSGIDPNELMDFDKRVITGETITPDAVQPLPVPPLPYAVSGIIDGKYANIKELSGQNDYSVGNSAAGMAASAITALQEAGQKRSRCMIDCLYMQYEQLIRLVVAFISNYYNETRLLTLSRTADFNIKLNDVLDKNYTALAEDENGQTRAIPYDYSEINLDDIDVDVNIEIMPQKHTPMTSANLNNMLLQLGQNGIFDGETILEGMEFDGKDAMLVKYKENQGKDAIIAQMDQQLQQMQEQMQQLAGAYEQSQQETAQAAQIAQQLQDENTMLAENNTALNEQAQLQSEQLGALSSLGSI